MSFEQNLTDASGSAGGIGQDTLSLTTAEQPSDELKDFQYGPCLDESHIRLLQILHNDEGSIIHYTLETYHLAKLPSYDALSYVWGYGDPDHIIACSEKALKITRSLHTIFLTLKRQRRFTYTDINQRAFDVPAVNLLWIDQICINQREMRERDNHIRIMRHIYQRADRVLISLGQNLPGPQVASVNRLLTAYGNMSVLDRCGDETTQSFPTHQDFIRLGLPVAADDSWSELKKISLMPYFTRIWVVQDVTVASEALIIFDEGVISWNLFLDAMEFFYRNGYYLSNTSMRYPNFRLCYVESMTFYILLGTESSEMDTSMALYSLVRRTRHLKSKEPKDKIYALVGIACDNNGVAIEYNTPDCEAFYNFARYTIAAEKNLNILSDVTYSGQDSDLNTPSWVPRWDMPPPAPLWRIMNFDVTCNSEACLYPHQEFKVLKVKGRELAVVTDRIACFDAQHSSQHLADCILDLIEKGFLTDDGTSRTISAQRLRELAWCILLGEHRFMEENSFGGDASDNLLHGFSIHIASGFMRSIRKRDVAGLKSFIALAQVVFVADSEYILTRPDRYAALNAESRESVEIQKAQILEMAPDVLKDQESLDDLYDKALRLVNREMVYRFYLATRLFALQEKSVFITNGGPIGVGRPTPEKDDIICILYGGSRPYAPRPTSKSGEYTFVGDCCIHGMMDGEGFQKTGVEQDKWFSLI